MIASICKILQMMNSVKINFGASKNEWKKYEWSGQSLKIQIAFSARASGLPRPHVPSPLSVVGKQTRSGPNRQPFKV